MFFKTPKKPPKDHYKRVVCETAGEIIKILRSKNILDDHYTVTDILDKVSKVSMLEHIKRSMESWPHRKAE